MLKSHLRAVSLVAMLFGLLALAVPAGAGTSRPAAAEQGEVVAIVDAERLTFATASPATSTDPYVRMLRRQDTPLQAWVYAPRKDGQTGFTFTNQETAGCLMLDPFGTARPPVVQRACTGGPLEAWVPRPTNVDGIVMIVNVGAGYCLTHPSPASSDTRLRASLCDGIRQSFRLLPLS
jgi:hypothetical protein